MIDRVDVKVIKKNGKECLFDRKKIERSIIHANMDVPPESQMMEGRVRLIADEAFEYCIAQGRPVRVSEIREYVESALITLGSAELAKRYIRFGASKIL